MKVLRAEPCTMGWLNHHVSNGRNSCFPCFGLVEIREKSIGIDTKIRMFNIMLLSFESKVHVFVLSISKKIMSNILNF
jgi:hypothetical protein